MFDFFKNADKKWKDSIAKIAANKISVQEFVDINEKKVLFYTTPVISDKDGNECLNAMSFTANNITYMPAFTNAEDLKKHYSTNNLVPNVIIKGNLKDALASLDSHPMIRGWGVVIDPNSPESVGIPPHVRVTPKCLR